MSAAIIGIDSAKMREGGDQTGYVVGFFANPSREPRYRVIRDATGAETDALDEYGYRIQLPTPTKPIFRIAEAGEFHHTPGVLLQDVVSRVATRGKAWGATLAVGDDFESTNVGATFQQRSIRFVPYAWTNPSKDEAIATLRRMIREGTLSITPHPGLLAEMLGLKFRITRGGNTDYRTSGKDLVSALISVAHYLNDPDAAGVSDHSARPLAGTPFRAYRGGRVEVLGR